MMSIYFAARADTVACTINRRPGHAVILCAVFCFLCMTARADPPWPSFEATTLTGKTVSSDRLIGQPTLLIVTPSREAAESTREWIKALRDEINQSEYRVRDVLAVDLPFFMSEADAIGRAKDAIPQRYYDQTWILNSQVLEKALEIPRASSEAAIIILNRNGNIVARVHGALNKKRLRTIVQAAKNLD